MVNGGNTWEIEGDLNIKNGGTVTFEDGSTLSGSATASAASEVEAIAGTEDAKFMSPATTKAVLDGRFGSTINDVEMVVGAEAAHVINVALQLKDEAGEDYAARGSVQAYLAADANGDTPNTTAPDGVDVIGTDGLALPIVAGKHFQLVSESDGDIDLDITESGAATMYLIVILPNGTLVASEAITFAGS
jgi:hypothetical protein